MKRFLIVGCAFSTFILVCLITFRIATKKKSSFDQPSQHQVELATQVADSLAKIKTAPLSLEDFSSAVHARAGTNLDVLSENERRKLFACINRFYACYASGSFADFKQFRLYPPFTLNEGLVLAAKKVSASKGIELKSDEDVLRVAWDQYNGTNKIGGINEESINLSAVVRHDMGESLRHSSFSRNWPELDTASCWEGAVLYQPTPADILKKEGALRFFTLEVFVRFNPQVDGPASPLVLLGYWDSTREDWMPYVLCSMLHAGSYDTIF
jgi:hypothetical protein